MKRPYIPPTVGEIRGPFHQSPGAPPRLYFYVYGGENGWLIIDARPGETESQCLARAKVRAAEVKGAAV